MSIEIRQMVVNASVQSQEDAIHAHEENHFDPELFRVEIMEACHDLIRQLYQQQQER